jgi:hypothetical protein
MKPFLALAILFVLVAHVSNAQQEESLASKQLEGSEPPLKHADPVYNDFSTDLGARKGSGQVNVNFGYQRMSNQHHELLSQLELEYAPMDNLGLELLLPYNVYFNNDLFMVERPQNRLEFLQWSAQYTLLSSYTRQISIAVGLTNSFEMESPEPPSNKGIDLKTITYNPFLTVAKNWKERYFFTFSGGPELVRELEPKGWDVAAQLNTAFHYGFTEQDHYVGVEFNKEISDGSFEMVIRPQLTLQLGSKLNLGAAFGIPIAIEDSRWSGFLRLAYEME